MKNNYLPKEAKIIGVIKENEKTNTLILCLPDQQNFQFVPGQFMMIGLPGFGECAISLSSDANLASEYLSLTIRAVGNLTQKLCQMKKGDKVFLRGPFGNGFPEMQGPTIIIGGGCGFIPLRSVLISNQKKIADWRVFIGCAYSKNLVFAADLANWEKRAEINVIFEKEIFPDVCPEKGSVLDILKKQSFTSKENAFICGPIKMYAGVVKILLQKGLKAENIWLSLEKRMHCGLGVCQHCAIGDRYVCKDGPVFDLRFLLETNYIKL